MSNFLTPLDVRVSNDGRKYTILDEFVYKEIKVPVGFVTDFASIPRAFWSILPPFGRYSKAAVIHDYLYLHQPMSRKKADGVFLAGMKELKVAWWKRIAMHRAVRMFGFIPWNNYKRAKEKLNAR